MSEEIEHGIQGFLLQKQAFQSQLIEVESALEELEKTKQAYKIVGNIMIAAKPAELKEELKQKEEMLKIRISNIEKQEQKFREKVKKNE